jgi:hypothetical protein
VTARTWLVECYAPGLVTTTVAGDGDRIRAAVEVVRSDGGSIEYLGALLVERDEAVFHAFRAETEQLIAAATSAAGLRFTRIVESTPIEAPGLGDALRHLLGTDPAASGASPPGSGARSRP